MFLTIRNLGPLTILAAILSIGEAGKPTSVLIADGAFNEAKKLDTKVKKTWQEQRDLWDAAAKAYRDVPTLELDRDISRYSTRWQTYCMERIKLCSTMSKRLSARINAKQSDPYGRNHSRPPSPSAGKPSAPKNGPAPPAGRSNKFSHVTSYDDFKMRYTVNQMDRKFAKYRKQIKSDSQKKAPKCPSRRRRRSDSIGGLYSNSKRRRRNSIRRTKPTYRKLSTGFNYPSPQGINKYCHNASRNFNKVMGKVNGLCRQVGDVQNHFLNRLGGATFVPGQAQGVNNEIAMAWDKIGMDIKYNSPTVPSSSSWRGNRGAAPMA